MVIAALLLLAAPSTGALAAFVERMLGPGDHRVAEADLNDDGTPEAIVLASGSRYCGSGGCQLRVLERSGGGYRLVSRSTVSRAPVRMLPGRSNGWHDLAVTVAGGGIGQARVARLRFDGRRYTLNPSIAPVVGPSEDQGRVLIAW